MNPALERMEITGLWARTFVSAMLGVSVVLSLKKYPQLCFIFFMAIFFASTINLVAYAWFSYQEGLWILPVDYFNKRYFFTKIETAFFGTMAIAVASANIIYLVRGQFDSTKKYQLGCWFFGIFIAIASGIASNTKNGVAMGLALCVILGLSIIFTGLTKSKSLATFLLPIIFLILLAGSAWKIHDRFSYRGWGTLFDDIKIGVQIENYPQWQNPRLLGYPKNSLGEVVAENTYERVAWATEGIKLILRHPLGYGSINRSFIGMLDADGVNHQFNGQTHSGWVDFGLAFGIPGLAILLTALLIIIYLGLTQSTQFSLMGVWIAFGLLPFCLIAETSFKQYFEAWIFFVAFATTCVLQATFVENDSLV